jgi:hypothetical protein
VSRFNVGDRVTDGLVEGWVERRLPGQSLVRTLAGGAVWLSDDTLRLISRAVTLDELEEWFGVDECKAPRTVGETGRCDESDQR